jgi:hypothetical protein
MTPGIHRAIPLVSRRYPADIISPFSGRPQQSWDSEGACARVNDDPIDFPPTTVKFHTASWNHPEISIKETSLANAVEDLCYGCLEQTHAGWENNDGAYGEFTFDIVERKITLDFNGRYTDTWSDAHTF